MPLTLTELLIASGVLIVGAVIQGSVGFGVGTLGAPILFLLNPFLVPGPMLIAGLALPALILLREWPQLEIRALPWALPGQIAGTSLAAAVVASLPENALALVFGLLVLAAVVMSFLGWSPAPTRRNLAIAGSLSGFMATATSIGGPPLALLYQGAHGPRLRATLSAIFVAGGCMAVGGLAVAGRFGIAELQAGLALLPAVWIGFWLSGFTVRFLDRAWLRPAVLGVSGVAGAGAVLRAVL